MSSLRIEVLGIVLLVLAVAVFVAFRYLLRTVDDSRDGYAGAAEPPLPPGAMSVSRDDDSPELVGAFGAPPVWATGAADSTGGRRFGPNPVLAGGPRPGSQAPPAPRPGPAPPSTAPPGTAPRPRPAPAARAQLPEAAESVAAESVAAESVERVEPHELEEVVEVAEVLVDSSDGPHPVVEGGAHGTEPLDAPGRPAPHDDPGDVELPQGAESPVEGSGTPEPPAEPPAVALGLSGGHDSLVLHVTGLRSEIAAQVPTDWMVLTPLNTVGSWPAGGDPGPERHGPGAPDHPRPTVEQGPPSEPGPPNPFARSGEPADEKPEQDPGRDVEAERGGDTGMGMPAGLLEELLGPR